MPAPNEPSNVAAPLLPPDGIARLRAALDPYTADGVDELLGPIGRVAHQRGDLAGVARAVRRSGEDGAVAVFTRLFLLGDAVAERAAAAAFAPLSLDAALSAGIVERDGDEVRALVDLRPYIEAGAAETGESEPWWVVSDLGSDVRPGPLARDHVLGIGNAATTLAQATPRDRVARALDIGTGCGVQALHLGRHAERVTATDISSRALRFAATSAALSGQSWQLRQGSFVEPVQGDRFDLVVANPPFVISPGTGAAPAEYDYRDSGRPGDVVCRDLVRGVVPLLDDGGTGQLLANWTVPREGSWQERVSAWFPPAVTAWVWQREVADLGEYVSMWLRDAGLSPSSPGWASRYDAWLDWFDEAGVAAVGMGLITLRRDREADAAADVVVEDVPQAVEQPIAPQIAAWFERHRVSPELLLRRSLRPDRDVVLTRHDLLTTDDGWSTRQATLRQSHGMRWELEVDDAVARIMAACAAGATPLVALEVLAAMTGDDPDVLADRFVPVLADLVRRGLLLKDGDG